MPIYEYKCDLCNGLWEELQKFSDDPLTVCKSCEKEGGVHKLVSGGIAYHLKGGGWAGDGYDKSGKGDHDGVYHWDADKGEVKNTLPEYLRHDQQPQNEKFISHKEAATEAWSKKVTKGAGSATHVTNNPYTKEVTKKITIREADSG